MGNEEEEESMQGLMRLVLRSAHHFQNRNGAENPCRIVFPTTTSFSIEVKLYHLIPLLTLHYVVCRSCTHDSGSH